MVVRRASVVLVLAVMAIGCSSSPSVVTTVRDVATMLSPREVLLRRGLRLEYATLAWNVAEVGFVFYAAVVARSVALAGFALDSCIEIFASLTVVERLMGSTRAATDRRSE